jgi:hypothetical protein
VRVTILDDYFDTLRTLDCFAALADHDVTVWTDHTDDPDELVRRLADTVALVLIREHTAILASTQVSSLTTPTALSNIPALVAATGQVAHVQVSLGLVATETSTNGVAPGSTVQGLSTTLTYTFTEQQRTGVATNQ